MLRKSKDSQAVQRPATLQMQSSPVPQQSSTVRDAVSDHHGRAQSIYHYWLQ